MQIIQKYCKLIIVFCCFMLLATKAFSHYRDDKSRFYLQSNLNTTVFSQINVSATTKDANKNDVISNQTFKLNTFDTQYNANIIAGFYFTDTGVSLELDLASYDAYYTKQDGKQTSNSNAENYTFSVDYVMTNLKFDIFSIYDLIFFIKGGIGFVQINQSQRNAKGGNKLEFAYQGGLGVYYPINRYLELEASYRYMGNLASKEEIAALNIPISYALFDNSILFGIRFKI